MDPLVNKIGSRPRHHIFVGKGSLRVAFLRQHDAIWTKPYHCIGYKTFLFYLPSGMHTMNNS